MAEQIKSVFELINLYGTPVIFTVIILFLAKMISASSGRWAEREHYYYTILKSLGSWKNSLADRLDYYLEPSSAYREEPTTASYIKMSALGSSSYEEIRSHIHIGRLFLNQHSLEAIEELISEYWHIKEFGAINTEDYLRQSIKIVDDTYNIILNSAKKDLAKSRYTELLKKALSKD